jgi:hypothetical protein
VRKALTWLAGAVGLAALLRHLSRRHASATVAMPVPVGPDPADELRRKLADQQVDGESAGAEEPEVADDGDATALEERRARVHAQAQAAIDSMRDLGGEDPEGGSGT